MNSSVLSLQSLAKDPRLVKSYLEEIKGLAKALSRPVRIMEFCGGHTHSLLKYGLDEALRPEIEFLHGPGCPVCVLSLERLELALSIAKERGVIFTTYGDLLRVPSPKGESLLTLRAKGHRIKMVANAMEAFSLAKNNPQELIVFFAFGFETTTPATAFLLLKAKEERITNLKVISNHLLTPAVLDFLLSKEGLYMDGIIGPGHVSAVIGAKAYHEVVSKFKVPMVVAGFEPLDLLEAILLLLKMISKGEYGVDIAYRRAVSVEGNKKAQELMKEVFLLREDFPWRGLGRVPMSGLALREEFSLFDGELSWREPEVKDMPKGCLCGEILKGRAKPPDCKLFRRACRPETPIGPCMVSSEGACLAYAKYKNL